MRTSLAAAESGPGSSPNLLEALQASARRATTPCGDGTVTWHEWGEGRPIVLLHGGSGSWRHWVRNIPVLAQTRRVLAPDLPGLGDSASPPEPRGPDSIADIVADGLARRLHDGTPCDLVGFSFGALIGGHLAARRPALVRSLTLVGAGALGLPRGPVQLVSVRSKTGEERVEANRTNLAQLMFADPAGIDAMALAIQDWNTRHARTVSVSYAGSASLLDALREVRAPLGAIWGERDAPAWPHLDGRIAALRGIRPDIEVRVIPGAGHWVMYEAAAAFDAALADLLNLHADRG